MLVSQCLQQTHCVLVLRLNKAQMLGGPCLHLHGALQPQLRLLQAVALPLPLHSIIIQMLVKKLVPLKFLAAALEIVMAGVLLSTAKAYPTLNGTS
jgi:hypothetical protein